MRASWPGAVPILVLLLPAALAADTPAGPPVSARIEVRVETVANRMDGTAGTCEAVQTRSVSAPSFAFWGTVAQAGAAGQCGPGTFPGGTTPASAQTPPPFLVDQVAADLGWSGGAMDPGPFGAFQVFLTLNTRQLTGVTKEGQAQYGTPVTDRRSVRLEPGEEFVVPLALDAHALAVLGVREVLVRVRAGWAGRDKATEYGALSVTDAAPGSEVILDGGVAGHAGADGSLLLSSLPVGQREVRVQGTTGTVVTRTVLLAKGMTVLVTPAAADEGSAVQPTVAATGKNAEGYQEYRRVRDGATMVEIPEGEFLMGNLETEGAPQPHTVYVSAFLMDKLPLTVGLYKRFAAATGRVLPPDPYWGVHDEYPVAFVRWDEGKAYCEWAGGRLPTEAEREKATRGTDGRMWPWGTEPPSPDRAVFRRNWGQLGNDAAGIRPAGAGPYGLLDTGGNMWEYCEDWYSPDYFKASAPKDPPGPKTGRARIVKGGSWDSRPTVLSASSRNFAYTGYREGDFGFRCASNLPR